MQQSYHHLSSEERAVIQVCRAQGQSLGAIAPALGRSASTISRELSKMPAQYNATDAAKVHLQCRAHSRCKKKIRDGTPLFTKVRNMLECRQCSPEQIAHKLKLENPDDPSMHLSHESIYWAIYAHPRNALKKLFISQLGRAKAKRGTRRSNKSATSIQLREERRIHARPQAIETRLTPGHWEGDLIMGAANRSAVGTVVERKTGFVLLCKLASKEALEVRTSFERQLAKIDSFMRLSMTYDRGCEMAQHALMSAKLKMHIYFADPHSPWQRGSNENINGLLGQYLPKGTDLSGVSQTRLNDIACLLNTRDRKRLGWDSPQDRFLADIENLKKGTSKNLPIYWYWAIESKIVIASSMKRLIAMLPRPLQDPGGAIKTGVFSHEERERKLEQLSNPLHAIAQYVDLDAIAAQLDQSCPRPSRHQGGRPPFPSTVMVRILLIEQIYNLSDEAMEFQLNDRLSFQRFCLLRDASNIPERTTVWKFRERIGEQGADSVFASVQRGLGRHGLIARKGQLIDASLVESPKQHFTKEEKEIVSEGAHPYSWTMPMRRQRDTEAKWTKKHAKSDYGYKLHVGVDNAYKLIHRLKVTPANKSDTRHFEGVLDPANTSKSVYADRGYVDKEHESRLRAQGMRVDIQRKAKANCPLSVAQGKRNHRIAKTRARVEHMFASLQAMGGKTVHCIGLRRARIALKLKAIGL